LVRGRYRTGGAIDEARLDFAPARYEARTIVFREWPDVERFDSLSAPIEHGFRVPPVATFLDGASVFGFTEPGAQFRSPAFPEPKQRDETCNEDREEGNGQF
jgi:hypothetical protein